MDEKISVIIPIYKVEKYLNRCVESVVNQSYQNLEIILVDDGSPDNCPKLCDDWAEKDKRIKVIHKENGGLSDARNAGMDEMSGEYVFFVDSDDWIHKDTLKILMMFQNRQDVDIVECKALPTSKEVTDDQIDVENIALSVLDTKEAMASLLREMPLKQTVWNKLYKRNIVEGIKFEVGKYHEDEFWTYQVLDRAKKILFVDVELYYYYQRQDSIMGQAFSLKRLDAIEGRYKRLEMFKENYLELVSEAKENLTFLIMYYGQQALKSDDVQGKKYFTIAQEYLKKIRITAQDLNQMSVTHKVWITGAKYNLKHICKLRNLMRIGIN